MSMESRSPLDGSDDTRQLPDTPLDFEVPYSSRKLKETLNPNKNRNRVPTEEERAVLKELVVTQRRISAFIDQQGNKLEEKQKDLLSVVYKQQLALEGTRSAIIQTKNVLALIEKHVEVCSTRIEELESLLNPIRIYSDDVLRLIFKAAVIESGNRLLQATRLSHVCTLWRSIALDTPHLWSNIHINLSINKTSQQTWKPLPPQYWLPVLERVKGAPLALNLCLTSPSSYSLRTWIWNRLPDVSAWERLTLRVTEGDFTLIDTPAFQPPKAPVPNLEIVREDNGSSTGTVWDIGSWMVRWPAITPLILSGFDCLGSMNTDQHPSIENLTLQNIKTLPLPAVLSRFPNLSSLTMKSVTLAKQSQSLSLTQTQMSKLQKVIARDMMGPLWCEGLHCPQIRFVDDAESPVPSQLTIFISSHDTIQHLRIKEITMTLDAIAPLLETLECGGGLGILHSWTHYGLKNPPFEHLRVLGINDRIDWVIMEALERLIMMRCLPRDHSTSLLPEGIGAIEELRIMSVYGDISNTKWGAYELLTTAIVGKEVLEDGLFVHTFRWSQ